MLKHILVPTNGSTMACHAVAQAISLTDEMNAELTLLAVIESFHMLAINSNEYSDQRQRQEKAAASDFDAMLARQKIKAFDRGIACKTLVDNGMDVAKTIVDTADHSNCDLIAMASHGRGALSSLLLGSVAAGVIAQSHIPVLVYR